MNESKLRETKLTSIIDKNQDVIGKLSEKFNIIEEIKMDIVIIKELIKK